MPLSFIDDTALHCIFCAFQGTHHYTVFLKGHATHSIALYSLRLGEQRIALWSFRVLRNTGLNFVPCAYRKPLCLFVFSLCHGQATRHGTVSETSVCLAEQSIVCILCVPREYIIALCFLCLVETISNICHVSMNTSEHSSSCLHRGTQSRCAFCVTYH